VPEAAGIDELSGPCPGMGSPSLILNLPILVAVGGDGPSGPDDLASEVKIADPAMDEGPVVAIPAITFAADFALVDQSDQGTHRIDTSVEAKSVDC
jgi:hypothetical protein